MPRRSGPSRSRPDQYIPYGKPDEVVIERVDYGGGAKPDVRWVETFKGVSLDDSPIIDARTPHHNKCAGRKGVKVIYWRDGRGWCRDCYLLQYQIEPLSDPLREQPPSRT